MTIKEQNDSKLIITLMEKLARIHAMEVPIKKSRDWILDYFDDCFDLANERFDVKDLIEKSQSLTLLKFDLGEEIQWLKTAIKGIDSPKVFSHNDFRGCNVMITETDGILLCDFEVSCYGFRGFDFGAFFIEWDRSWGDWDMTVEFPSDETLKPFINAYIEESVKLKGKAFIEDERNSLQHILKEVKVLSLAELMFLIVLFLQLQDSFINGIPLDKIKTMVRHKIFLKNN